MNYYDGIICNRYRTNSSCLVYMIRSTIYSCDYPCWKINLFNQSAVYTLINIMICWFWSCPRDRFFSSWNSRILLWIRSFPIILTDHESIPPLFKLGRLKLKSADIADYIPFPLNIIIILCHYYLIDIEPRSCVGSSAGASAASGLNT